MKQEQRTVCFDETLGIEAAGQLGFSHQSLTHTIAFNVGGIISIASFFTVLFPCFILHDEKPTVAFFIGFVVLMVGICLISFNGNTVLKFNPMVDVLQCLPLLFMTSVPACRCILFMGWLCSAVTEN